MATLMIAQLHNYVLLIIQNPMEPKKKLLLTAKPSRSMFKHLGFANLFALVDVDGLNASHRVGEIAR